MYMIEDIRFKNKPKPNKLNKFLLFIFIMFKKHWVKFLIFSFIVIILLYPDIVGNITGEWFNKLINAFLNKLTF